MYIACHVSFAFINICLYCTQFHRLLFGTSGPTSQETHWSPIKTNQSVYVAYGNSRDVQEKKIVSYVTGDYILYTYVSSSQQEVPLKTY